MADFVFRVSIELLGQETACLGSALAGFAVWEMDDASLLIAYPSMFLAFLVRKLEELQAKIGKVVMDMYREIGLMPVDDCKSQMMRFFQYYTVETTSGTLEVHETPDDNAFKTSTFRVHLIDTNGCLMKLLSHIENFYSAGTQLVVAVDFEGVKLCRSGPLCLVQLVCSDDPRLVYVLDVHVLGKRAFTMTTPKGTSIQGLLEDQRIIKVWFDPRNDIDALWHQFGIYPNGIFDLQLAEVADRRSKGLNVSYVQGLFKCLTQCNQLEPEQKVFADRINSLGKRLFEPQCGGDYEIFRNRPLHPVILVYAAHDTRYMLLLYEQYVASIGGEWVQRVMRGAQERSRWCLSPDYVLPGSEAPNF